MKTKGDGKNRVIIVGSVVSGGSGEGWFGTYTGSASVMRDIGATGDIDVYVNSPGGSVFAGFEILNAFKAAVDAGRTVNVYISAMAASIASYITTGIPGAKVHMADNAKLMFHAPWVCVTGSKDQLRDYAKLLEQMEGDISAAVTSRGAKAEADWFAAGRAKWISAKEAVAMKLADDIMNPPQDLVVAAAKGPYKTTYRDDGYSNSAENGKKSRNALSGIDMFAASTSLDGLLQSLCADRFGEDVVISETADGVFRATLACGKTTLLKYKPDSLNIVAIDWEGAQLSEPERENNMKTQAQLEEEARAANEAAEKAKADAAKAEAETAKAEAAKAKEAVVKANADIEAAKAEVVKANEAVSKATADLEAAKAKQIPDGVTSDMLAFAQANYKVIRDQHIATIKANKANDFSDEELNSQSFDFLARLAKISAGADSGKLMPDNSLIETPSSKSKGTEATLPPPEL